MEVGFLWSLLFKHRTMSYSKHCVSQEDLAEAKGRGLNL